MGDDTCDYCFADLNATCLARAVGFDTQPEGLVPVVKFWCGTCTPGDRIDEGAARALLKIAGA